MRAWSGILLAGLFIWLAACGATNPPPPSPVAETPLVSTPVATNDLPALPTRVPAPTRNLTPDPSQPIVLTIWVPEEFAAGAERGGDILEQQIAEFEATYPNVQINYVLKAPYGKGGILDWLTQLQELMPERLPDAAVVDSRELQEIQALGLVHPLQRALPSGAFWDLFPPAQTIARHDGQWDNQPIIIETEHLVYDARRVTVPPASWETVLAEKNQFAFAADSTESFLLHYLENGGSLATVDHPASDASVMQTILDYYQRSRANGTLNENAAAMQSAREVMPLFVSGQTPLAQVRARDFLSEKNRLPNALAAPIPTRDGRATTLVSSWTFVIITNDAAKQTAAANYLLWLIDPRRLGEWANAARLIPASKSAFAQGMEQGAYADVLWSLLQNAIVAPDFSKQSVFANAWHAAVQAVLNGQLAPEDAAFRAVQSITQ